MPMLWAKICTRVSPAPRIARSVASKSCAIHGEVAARLARAYLSPHEEVEEVVDAMVEGVEVVEVGWRWRRWWRRMLRVEGEVEEEQGAEERGGEGR